MAKNYSGMADHLAELSPVHVSNDELHDNSRFNSALYSLLEPMSGTETHAPDNTIDFATWISVRSMDSIVAVNNNEAFMFVAQWCGANAFITVYVRDPTLDLYSYWKILEPDNKLYENYGMVRPWSGAMSVMAQETPGGAAQGTISGAAIQSAPNLPTANYATLNPSKLSVIALDESASIPNVSSKTGVVVVKPPGGDNSFVPQRTTAVRPVNQNYSTYAQRGAGTGSVAGWLTPADANSGIVFDSSDPSTPSSFIPANETGAVYIEGVVSLVGFPVVAEYVRVSVVVFRRSTNYPTTNLSALVASTYVYDTTVAPTTVSSPVTMPFSFKDSAAGTVERVLVVWDAVTTGTFHRGDGLCSISLTSEELSFSWDSNNVGIVIINGLGAGQNVILNATQGYDVLPDAHLAKNVKGGGGTVSGDFGVIEQIESVFRRRSELGVRFAYQGSEYLEMKTSGRFRSICSKASSLAAADWKSLLRIAAPAAARIVGAATGQQELGEIAANVSGALLASSRPRPLRRAADLPYPAGLAQINPQVLIGPQVAEALEGSGPAEDAANVSEVLWEPNQTRRAGGCVHPQTICRWRASSTEPANLEFRRQPTEADFAAVEPPEESAVRLAYPGEVIHATVNRTHVVCRTRGCTGQCTSGASPQKRFTASGFPPEREGSARPHRPISAGLTHSYQTPSALRCENISAAAIVAGSLLALNRPRYGYAPFIVVDPEEVNRPRLGLVIVTPSKCSATELGEGNLADYRPIRLEGVQHYYTSNYRDGQQIEWVDFETQLMCVLTQLPALPSMAIHLLIPDNTSGSSAGLALYMAINGVATSEFYFTGGYATDGAGKSAKVSRTLIDCGSEKLAACQRLIGITGTVVFSELPQTIPLWWQIPMKTVAKEINVFLPAEDESQALLFFLRGATSDRPKATKVTQQLAETSKPENHTPLAAAGAPGKPLRAAGSPGAPLRAKSQGKPAVGSLHAAGVPGESLRRNQVSFPALKAHEIGDPRPHFIKYVRANQQAPPDVKPWIDAFIRAAHDSSEADVDAAWMVATPGQRHAIMKVLVGPQTGQPKHVLANYGYTKGGNAFPPAVATLAEPLDLSRFEPARRAASRGRVNAQLAPVSSQDLRPPGEQPTGSLPPRGRRRRL